MSIDPKPLEHIFVDFCLVKVIWNGIGEMGDFIFDGKIFWQILNPISWKYDIIGVFID